MALIETKHVLKAQFSIEVELSPDEVRNVLENFVEGRIAHRTREELINLNNSNVITSHEVSSAYGFLATHLEQEDVQHILSGFVEDFKADILNLYDERHEQKSERPLKMSGKTDRELDYLKMSGKTDRELDYLNDLELNQDIEMGQR